MRARHFSTAGFRHLVVVLGLACVMGITGQASAAQQLLLPANPLFVSNDVAPNIMFMIDSSGSMTNVVADAPYNPATTYLSNCPSANRVPAGTAVELHIRTSAQSGNNGPKIFYSNTRYDWGTGSGQRCFISNADYTAGLNVDAEGGTVDGSWYTPAFLPAQYSGNYLNWYFNPASVSGVTWNNRQRTKPLPTSIEPSGFVLSRIKIARAAGQTLVNSLDNRLRVGLSVYSGDDGGTLRVAIAPLANAQRTALTTGSNGIANIVPSGNTPLAETLSDIGRYFATGYTGALTMTPKNPPRTVTPTVAQAFPSNLSGAPATAPIVLSCQANFAVLLTDGRPTQDNSTGQLAISGSSPANVMADYDGDCHNRNPACLSSDRKPNQFYESNNGSDYLDDVAQALFETDLRPDFAVESDGQQYKNNVITHMIGFADSDVQDDPLLLRTAQQGGGQFRPAADSAALVTAFNSIITDILERSGSFASAAVNSTSVTSQTLLFRAAFNSANWAGEVTAFPISTGSGGRCSGVARGRPCPTPVWNSATKLNSATPGSRTILSYNLSTRAGIPFRWASLPATQQALLNRNPNVLPTLTADTEGENRLNYLRGDRGNEGAGRFRARGGRLGDIVNSDPAYVGPPSAALPFAGYSTFRNTHKNRTPMVYVGGNDGMLHGFDAPVDSLDAGGVERLAYVPGSLYGNNANPRLARLTAQPYSHVYGVDGSPTAGDVQIGANNTWATYLVGTLRYGGQGVFALDVTNPANFSEANAASIVKWEFTDADDADLGYTFSQPSIVKLRNGKWAAIIGNGYNNGEAGNVGSGRAALFVLYLDGPGADGVWNLGTDYLKFVVGPTPGATETDNGLSTPAAVDLDGDSLTDYVYAGDLRGNVWQFNLKCNPAVSGCTWGTAYGGNPLFVARSNTNALQPITAPPEVGFNLMTSDPDDLIVYVGTGRYFVTGDNTQQDQESQTFYGVFANPISALSPFAETTTSPNPTKANLLRQKVLMEPTANGNTIRVTTRDPFTRNATGDITQKGWYIDLYNVATAGLDPTPASDLNRGERQVSRPILLDGRIIFTTLIPSEQPCEFGGTGWLMELDARSGGRPDRPVLDITNNLTVDSQDVATVTLNGQQVSVPASGVRSSTGMLSTPAVLAVSPGQLVKYSVRSDGSIAAVGDAGASRVGRVTWREILQ